MQSQPVAAPLSDADILDSCARVLAARLGGTRWRLQNLSPGLSSSRIYRVSSARGERYIVKIPDWDRSAGLRNSDPLSCEREIRFWKSGLPAQLSTRLRLPRLLGIDERAGRSLLWMEALDDAFAFAWTPGRAIAALGAAAALDDVYRRHADELHGLPWLSRDVFCMFENYQQEAYANLARLGEAQAAWLGFPGALLPGLQAGLALRDWAVAALHRLPFSLIHGDFHPRNIGFTGGKSPIVTDWANVGLGPLGSDLATFMSLYGVFAGVRAGRRRRELERALLHSYCRALGLPRERWDQVAHCCWLWAVTWGLHLRLGPGLTALLDGRIRDATLRATTFADILEGCDRALHGVADVPRMSTPALVT